MTNTLLFFHFPLSQKTSWCFTSQPVPIFPKRNGNKLDGWVCGFQGAVRDLYNVIPRIFLFLENSVKKMDGISTFNSVLPYTDVPSFTKEQ